MASQALYLKWRSQTFEEVVGQEHVTRTLRHALERGKIAHAYLFCGPRGTGKTSTARILAKAVNCLSEGEVRPCNHCAICKGVSDGSLLDLIEIDAASNTSVDDVRDLRDRIAFRPGQARYKVYIIDEVHMLSTSAFNALLKTLEEPPPHVIFVLATTDPQKIPATVISRCQRFDFRFVPTSLIAGHLGKIVEAEGLKAEPEALDLIAAHAGGAVRDAVTLLDQLTAYGDDGITVGHVQSVLGIGESSVLVDFAAALIGRDMPAGLAIIDRLVDQGIQLRQFNADLLEYLRGMLLLKAGGDPRLLHLSPDARQQLRGQAGQVELGDLVRYARLFSDAGLGLRGSLQPQLPLELAFIEAAAGRAVAAHEPAAVPKPAPARSSAAPAHAPATTTAKPAGGPPQPAATPKPAQTAAQTPPAPGAVREGAPAGGDAVSLDDVRRRWRELVQQVRPLDMQVEAHLRSAQPTALDAGVLTLSFKYPFNRDKFEERNGGSLVAQIIARVMGQPLTVRCQVEGKAPAATTQAAAKPANTARPAPPAKPASTPAADDPLVQAAKQMGGRVKRVSPAGDEPPPPEAPPPAWDEPA